MQAVAAACPHCRSLEHGGGSFCVACGMALPGPRKPPRIVGDKDYAASAAGMKVQSDLMESKAKAASTILLVIGVLQVLGAVLLVVLLGGISRDPAAQVAAFVTGGIVLAIALGFFGLAVWAKRSPLPAATIGLLTFVSLVALDVALSPGTAANGWIIKVVILVALIKAVQAGIKHRELRRIAEASAAGSP